MASQEQLEQVNFYEYVEVEAGTEENKQSLEWLLDQFGVTAAEYAAYKQTADFQTYRNQVITEYNQQVSE